MNTDKMYDPKIMKQVMLKFLENYERFLDNKRHAQGILGSMKQHFPIKSVTDDDIFSWHVGTFLSEYVIHSDKMPTRSYPDSHLGAFYRLNRRGQELFHELMSGENSEDSKK